MKALLTRADRRFITDFAAAAAEWQTAASQAEALVAAAVRRTGIEVHAVTARAKSVDSLRGKLRKKAYPDPEKGLTDGIGVRVITHYQPDCKLIEAQLRQEFRIKEADSEDKSELLKLEEFGYRSIHLIARTKPHHRLAGNRELGTKWFEIQIRTVLEHAWAAIGHDIVYKGGTKYPKRVKRSFNAVSATLEILDGAFLQLRNERKALISAYREAYAAGYEVDQPLDAARMIAFLSVFRPTGKRWQSVEAIPGAVPKGFDAACVAALAAAKIGTAQALRSVMESAEFTRALQRFAVSSGLGIDGVSDLAAIVIAVGVTDPRLLRDHFREMLFDPALARALESKP